MRYIVLISFFFGGSFLVNAQDNFFKGYYVSQEGDTIKGLIEDRSDRGNFNSCNFKLSPDAQVETFSSEDILAFGFDKGVAYQEFIFRGKNSEILDGFFKILVKGKLTLVNYESRYFAVNDKGEIYEVTKNSSEASGRTKESFQGLGHLKLLMSDCPTTNEAWLLKQYSDRNLEKIFITYNKCVNSSVMVLEEPRSQMKFNFGVQILPSVITMKGPFPMDGISKNITLNGGFFVSIRNPRKWLGTAVILEGNNYQYNGYKYFRDVVKTNTNNDVFVKYNGLQFPLYLRVGQKYYFDLGVQNIIVLKQDLRWRVETETTIVQTTDNDLNKLDMYSLGFLVGGGAKFDVGSHPLCVFARYTQTASRDSGKHVSASIGVSFQFTKN